MGERLFVIDPGGPDPSVLRDELDRRVKDGAELAGVILTIIILTIRPATCPLV